MFNKINFTKLGINITLLGLKLQGKIPTRRRDNKTKDNKYTISYTSGGESLENFLKISVILSTVSRPMSAKSSCSSNLSISSSDIFSAFKLLNAFNKEERVFSRARNSLLSILLVFNYFIIVSVVKKPANHSKSKSSI